MAGGAMPQKGGGGGGGGGAAHPGGRRGAKCPNLGGRKPLLSFGTHFFFPSGCKKTRGGGGQKKKRFWGGGGGLWFFFLFALGGGGPGAWDQTPAAPQGAPIGGVSGHAYQGGGGAEV